MPTENVIEVNEHICLIWIGMNNYRSNVEVVWDGLHREENRFWPIILRRSDGAELRWKMKKRIGKLVVIYGKFVEFTFR